jgi:hypothetical protein
MIRITNAQCERFIFYFKRSWSNDKDEGSGGGRNVTCGIIAAAAGRVV